jgi:hypothetical protein
VAPHGQLVRTACHFNGWDHARQGDPCFRALADGWQSTAASSGNPANERLFWRKA